MPLTKTGEKVEKKFEEEYGEKKGKGYFYAKENKDKKFKGAMTKAIENRKDKDDK